MKKCLIIIFCLNLFLQSAYAIQDTTTAKEYRLVDCIQYGLEHSPYINDLKLKLMLVKEDVSIAKANYFPTTSAGVGYWQGFNTYRNFDDGYTKRDFPSVGVYLNQLIYDFGKTNNLIDMQKFYLIAAQYHLADSICYVVNDIKLKYFNVLEAKYAVNIESDNYALNKLIVEQTKELYEKGEKQEIDYLNALVHLSSAQMNLETAQNVYINAKEDLYKSMYVVNSEPFELVDIDTFDYYHAYFTPMFLLAKKGEWHKIQNREHQNDIIGNLDELSFSQDFAIEEAYKNSPDIKAMENIIKAAKKSLEFTKKEYYPTLTGRVGYEFNNRYKEIEEATHRNNQLNVSVNLGSSVNIYKYLSTTKQAEYRLAIAENDLDLFKINLYHDVKKYYTDVETAQKQIKIVKDKVHKAAKTLQVTADAYIHNVNGIGYLDVQNARENYNNAKLEFVAQLRIYNTSLAKLERISHIHDKSYFDFVYSGIDKQLLPKELR